MRIRSRSVSKSDETRATNLGFIAEDVPDEVATADHKAIFYNHIVAALTGVVKQQQEAIARLTEQVGQLRRDGRSG